VPHYWILDPDEKVLVVLTAGSGETVRAEPFDAVPLDLGAQFGEEPD